MIELLRVYLDPAEIGDDGYPFVWHGVKAAPPDDLVVPALKDLVREQAGHRCVRCGHPYRKGKQHGNGEWTPCDERCAHAGPLRVVDGFDLELPVVVWSGDAPAVQLVPLPGQGARLEAQWRILTVHHLNGVKHDCRWWNLVALCQRCHLTIQGRVRMERVWPWEHTDWFKPYVAGYYASVYLAEELSRPEVEARLDELLALERVA